MLITRSRRAFSSNLPSSRKFLLTISDLSHINHFIGNLAFLQSKVHIEGLHGALCESMIHFISKFHLLFHFSFSVFSPFFSFFFSLESLPRCPLPFRVAALPATPQYAHLGLNRAHFKEIGRFMPYSEVAFCQYRKKIKNL